MPSKFQKEKEKGKRGDLAPFFFLFLQKMMNTSENITQKEESLSAFVTFRIRPSALESLSTLVESTRMTRSELIRRTLGRRRRRLRRE